MPCCFCSPCGSRPRLVSLPILQPFVLNRGGRAAAATVATADLAVLSNPGAAVTEYTYRSEWLSRTTEVEVSLPLGSVVTELGSIQSRIGTLGFGSAEGGGCHPCLREGRARRRRDSRCVG